MNEKTKLTRQYKHLKKKYIQLQKEYDETPGYLYSYSQQLCRQEELICFQHDYIHWKTLDEEFALFQKYAHEEDSNTGFPYLVM